MADGRPLRQGWKFRWGFIANEIAARVFILVAAVIISKTVKVFNRSTQAKDWPDHAYPYASEERFPAAMAFGVLAAITFLYLIVGCLLLRYAGRWTPTMIYEEVLLWLLGFSLSNVLVYLGMDVTKRMYGRLRPDYLSRCFGSNDVSVWMAALNYTSWNDLPEIVNCTGWTKLSDSMMEDAKMSFPSGHSAFSFNMMTWTALWAYSKLTLFADWGAWRIAIPTCPIAFALVVAISRTMDYRHHPTDVLGGSIMGIVISVLIFKFYFPLRMKPIANTLYEHYQRIWPHGGQDMPRVLTADLAYLRRCSDAGGAAASTRRQSWEESGEQV